MKKSLSWRPLLIISVVSYILSFIIGGIIGDALRLLGFLMLIFTVIAGIRVMVNKKSNKTTTNKVYNGVMRDLIKKKGTNVTREDIINAQIEAGKKASIMDYLNKRS